MCKNVTCSPFKCRHCIHHLTIIKFIVVNSVCNVYWSTLLSFFLSYCHNGELVQFLNQFADTQMDLPAGWEQRFDAKGRVRKILFPVLA